MTHWNTQPHIPNHIIASGLLTEPFVLFDVGVSGGIDKEWNCFGSRLHVHGFDPKISEIDRLNQLKRPNHVYSANFVGCPAFRQEVPAERRTANGYKSTDSFSRTSASWATRFLREEGKGGAAEQYVQEDQRITLDDYARAHNLSQVDFVKIDTDGGDYEVLMGMKDLLASQSILGIQIEAQFHGPVDDNANIFSNIDRFLRENGFALFDMDPWRYSRASLPQKFVLPIPGQTYRGQVLWAEALYLRDMAAPKFEANWPEFQVNLQRIYKLLALFDMCGLADCAVELADKYKARLTDEAGIDLDELLSPLIPRINGLRVPRKLYEAHCMSMIKQRKFEELP
ncbi:conserved protein of unknown function [Magnetospira sp. QH-2]|nr:FkbM family methyltransferase [Magnetospira sp. QH-2]CCQ73055.1 conserved protein of unknown function [Magnetospira sp. QH-2]